MLTTKRTSTRTGLQPRTPRSTAASPAHQACLTADQFLELGVESSSRGELTKAIALLESAAAMYERDHNTESEGYARTLANVARPHALLGHYRRAEALYLRAINLYERILGPKDKYLGTLRGYLGLVQEWMAK